MSIKSLSIAQGSSYKWWAYSAIAVGLFASVADIGSVVVALPTISEHFGTDLPTTQWVIIGYALTISALLLPMGRLSDIVGRKQIYIVGFGIFVIGAVLAGVSASMLWLILSRVVMGVGAAMTQGISMAILVSAFPSEERGKALGLQLSAVGAGGVVGPVMGGFIVGALGWRGVFFITAVLGVLSIAVAQAFLDGRRAHRDEKREAFDWLGAALSGAVLVAFLLAMSYGHRMGWGSPPIVITLLGVVALLGVFVWWELRTAAPMMDVRLFKRRLFSMGVSASFISFIGFSSVRFLMPFYLQAVLGYSPRQIGLILVPAALTMIVTGPVGGRLSDRYGWRKFNVGGMTLAATGLFILSRLTEDSSLVLVMAAMVIQTTGGGIFNAPNNSSILSVVEPGRQGVASGFLNLIRNSANVTGVAVATAIVTAIMAAEGFQPSLAAVSDATDTGVLSAFTSGLRVAYLATGCVVVVGIGLSFAKGGRVDERRPQRAESAEAHREVRDVPSAGNND